MGLGWVCARCGSWDEERFLESLAWPLHSCHTEEMVMERGRYYLERAREMMEEAKGRNGEKIKWKKRSMINIIYKLTLKT